MRHPERKQRGRQQERGRQMRRRRDAGRPCVEVISRMEERGQQEGGEGSEIQTQQGQCRTFRK